MENEFVLSQLITYIGNKRALLEFIGGALGEVKRGIGSDKLRICDMFSGSSVVSRYFKAHASYLAVNDLEDYCRVISECYMSNRSQIDMAKLERDYAFLQENLRGELEPGFISELYAPRDMQSILPHERVFYTPRNAKYIDTARTLIAQLPQERQHYFIAPLLSEASIKNNTAGIFKGFYKNREGVGQYGGSGRNALARICADIELPFPVFSQHECAVQIFQRDAGELAGELPPLDLVYLDPPYNQHPYGSNYFMLNLICNYERPRDISRVSGIPTDWNRSSYNSKSCMARGFFDLCSRLNSRFLLVSFNSEGFITEREMESSLSQMGKVNVMRQKYNTFRGSRNLGERSTHVHELLFLVDKG